MTQEGSRAPRRRRVPRVPYCGELRAPLWPPAPTPRPGPLPGAELGPRPSTRPEGPGSRVAAVSTVGCSEHHFPETPAGRRSHHVSREMGCAWLSRACGPGEIPGRRPLNALVLLYLPAGAPCAQHLRTQAPACPAPSESRGIGRETATLRAGSSSAGRFGPPGGLAGEGRHRPRREHQRDAAQVPGGFAWTCMKQTREKPSGKFV